MKTKQVVVSPDLVPHSSGGSDEQVDSVSLMAKNNERVILLPMAEWKQVLVRALRATIPAFIVLAGGGTAAQAATGAGVPPLMMVGLPSTGIFVIDTFLICLVIFVLWACWVAIEFWLDLDENHPKLRA